MNNRGHLPAGQAVQGGMDMGHGSGGGGPRRGGRPQPYPAHYHPHMGHQPIHHNSYTNQYAPAAPFYHIPSQYQNGNMGNNMGGNMGGSMGSPGFLVYPPGPYTRSPPSMQQHYAPMAPPPYSRPAQHSPIVSAAYHNLPHDHNLQHAPIPVPPQTPSSTHSLHAIPPPLTPPTQQIRDAPQLPPQPLQPYQIPHQIPHLPQAMAPPAQIPMQPVEQQEPPRLPQAQPEIQAQAVSPPRPLPRAGPFRPPLPWLSRPDLPFPSRTTKSKRRRRMLETGNQGIELPVSQQEAKADLAAQTQAEAEAEASPMVVSTPKATSGAKLSTMEGPPARSDTPSTQAPPSEYATSTSPTTPTSVQTPHPSTATVATPTGSAKRTPRAAIPALPLVPALPRASPKAATAIAHTEKAPGDASQATGATPADQAKATAAAPSDVNASEPAQDEAQPAPAPAPVKVAPKLWTGLFSKPAQPAGTGAAQSADQNHVNGGTTTDGSGAAPGASGFSKSNATSLAEALQAYQVGGAAKIAFLEPKGLINTGNMCYMNSVLQILLYCTPFYDCLDQAAKKAAYSFKSETPLLDAMIMFQREFKVIDSAASVEQLRRRLKSEELEQYGEPFTPEFVYDAIRTLPRFASMRRGHQQDAEEFLGFLLEGLHDDCAQVMRAATASNEPTSPNSGLPTPTQSVSSKTNDVESGDVWLEVGPRQRSAITRSSGHSNVDSPVTKIFGGQLRSELRVPGLKNSVTLEPYQPLQLDIGAPDIRNIVDALKGLTRSETLHGDFNSPHGKGATATKQVFIDSLPPVLILHLKRFQFDAEVNGTVKIWKKVGYPLELEVPRDVLSRPKRNAILAEGAGMPKYKLTGVVYHHGKNASGGHYTVDVRRQDGIEWIRIDDTVIRRLRAEDVAEGGAEEKATKAAPPDNRKDAAGPAGPANNRFLGINDEEGGDDEGWKQVSGAVNGNKKWSSVVNSGPTSRSTTPKGKQVRDNIKDNKVAYLLFYEKI